MAKPRDTPITARDLAEYLAQQDDFALELSIYSKARQLGLSATHGGTYEDPLTKKPRQYDVRAFAERGDQRIDLAIECKSLRKSFPLIVSRIPRAPEESFHHVVWSYKPSRSPFDYANAGMPPAKTLVVGRERPFYGLAEPVGKSTAQVGRSERAEFVVGDAEVHDKWAQALASAAELIQDAAYLHEDSSGGLMATAVLPLLVVADETLWVADYSDAGAVIAPPHTTDEVLLFVGRDYSSPMGLAFTISHLHICTRVGAEKFLERVARDDALWERLLPREELLTAATEA